MGTKVAFKAVFFLNPCLNCFVLALFFLKKKNVSKAHFISPRHKWRVWSSTSFWQGLPCVLSIHRLPLAAFCWAPTGGSKTTRQTDPFSFPSIKQAITRWTLGEKKPRANTVNMQNNIQCLFCVITCSVCSPGNLWTGNTKREANVKGDISQSDVWAAVFVVAVVQRLWGTD